MRSRITAVALSSLSLLAVVPAVVRAHGAPADHGVGVSFGVVVAAALGIGVVAGLTVLFTGISIRAHAMARFDRVVGVFLIVLGIALAVTAIGEYSVLAVAGVLGGGVVAWTASSRARGTHHADVTLVALGTHRVVEGAVLAAVYLAGAAVGTLGVVLIVGHVAVETAAVAGLYVAAGTDPARVLVAIGLMQAGFGVGVLGGTVLATGVPETVQAIVVAAGAGVLLVVGNAEMNGHHRHGPDPPGEKRRSAL
ncbi:hypothetical protein [Natronorarus salvus]|uniref:hypothetical protein n=1 Tax=Natronorarus salvus TaxID=3117733 RepID=UPI002F26707D